MGYNKLIPLEKELFIKLYRRSPSVRLADFCSASNVSAAAFKPWVKRYDAEGSPEEPHTQVGGASTSGSPAPSPAAACPAPTARSTAAQGGIGGLQERRPPHRDDLPRAGEAGFLDPARVGTRYPPETSKSPLFFNLSATPLRRVVHGERCDGACDGPHRHKRSSDGLKGRVHGIALNPSTVSTFSMPFAALVSTRHKGKMKNVHET